MCDFRVLSIQSHVVYGYVGNKSATFPLQVCRYIQKYCHVTQRVFRKNIVLRIYACDVTCDINSENRLHSRRNFAYIRKSNNISYQSVLHTRGSAI